VNTAMKGVECDRFRGVVGAVEECRISTIKYRTANVEVRRGTWKAGAVCGYVPHIELFL
jgi:hypothetical protein